MNAPFLRESKEGVYLAIKLQPRASRVQIGGVHGSELKISVTAPPVDSAANDALIEYLAEILDVARSSLELVKGKTSRHKSVLIRGANAAYVLKLLKL